LIHTNLLRDVSPHASLYATKLQKAVEENVDSLVKRERSSEGNGLRELYRQSFKDPGSAELLDALLRQRPTERQTRDFMRYVEDVERLSFKKAVVIIPSGSVGSGDQADLGKRILSGNGMANL